MRAITGVALLAALSGCSKTDKAASTVAEGGETIACAIGESTELKDVCTVERAKMADALQLVVHHPDGGFRRFEVRPDSNGLAPADGADDAQREVRNGKLDITVSGDTYRFPATIETDVPVP